MPYNMFWLKIMLCGNGILCHYFYADSHKNSFCSAIAFRFHALQEFDEGKRSCRRRLAGHNKRRRKTNPDAATNSNPLNDDQTNGCLLISLLKILSNMHSKFWIGSISAPWSYVP